MYIMIYMKLRIKLATLLLLILGIFVFALSPHASFAQQPAEVENYFNLTLPQLQQLYNNQINMYTNCLEPYYILEQGGGRLSGDATTDYAKSSWNGESHVVMLKNKTTSPFLNNAPIQVARTINNTTMCALDSDNKPTCTTLYQQQIGNTSATGDFKLLDMTRSQLTTTNGNLTLPHVKSYSADTVNHDFVGIQYFTVQQGAQGSEDTDSNSLKLATFYPAQELPDGAADCLQIHWDPFGKVIDAQSLEPIKDATVSLFYRDTSGNRAPVPVNSGILPKNVRSTFQTSADGGFNFPVIPGTYFLEATKSGFTYPIEDQLLEQARSVLQQTDPQHMYLDSDKLYNNPSEEIVVTAQNPQERNIVMKNSEPTNSQPEITQYRIVRNNDTQVITGSVSHAASIVQAFLGNSQIGQAVASKNGFFRMEILSSSLPSQFDPNLVYLQAQKQAIINFTLQSKKTHVFETIARILNPRVYAATTNVSPHYPIKLIPLYVSGFAYSDSLKITPNALVQITIPSLGNAVYAQARADKNGFVFIGKHFTPPYQFDVRIVDSAKNTVAQYEANDFIALNKTYAADKKVNFYTPPETAVSSPASFIPSVQLVKEVHASELDKEPTAVAIAKNSAQKRMMENRITTTPTSSLSEAQKPADAQKKNVGLLATLAAIMVLVPVGIGYVVMKAKDRTQI